MMWQNQSGCFYPLLQLSLPKLCCLISGGCTGYTLPTKYHLNRCTLMNASCTFSIYVLWLYALSWPLEIDDECSTHIFFCKNRMSWSSSKLHQAKYHILCGYLLVLIASHFPIKAHYIGQLPMLYFVLVAVTGDKCTHAPVLCWCSAMILRVSG